MESVQVPFDNIVEDHRELNRMTQELFCFLRMPQPDIMDEKSHRWAGELAEQLVRFHRKVFIHCREEEQPGGILDELSRRFPWTTKTVQNLQEEHAQILAEMRAIVAGTMICAENKLPSDPDLCGRTKRLLRQIAQHRKTENDLLMQVYWEDLGEVGA